MNHNMIPTFKKVEILLKDYSSRPNSTSISKLEFEDAGMVITGNHMIITIKEFLENSSEVVQTSKIYSLNDISAYRTYNKN